jgi:hypothetical protein
MYYIMLSIFYQQVILFIVMFLVGIIFNPMNMLAYSISDIYLSLTLIYSGLLMASNMIWSHQIVHYFSMGHFNTTIFAIGVLLSIGCVFLLRKQVFVTSNQWLKRMIGHHSTAITTTTQLLQNEDNFIYDSYLFTLAKNLVYQQEKEILLMKNMI